MQSEPDENMAAPATEFPKTGPAETKPDRSEAFKTLRVRSRRERVGDLSVMVAIAAGVFALLGASGTVGWVEAFTAFLVFVFAVAAFITATTTEATSSDKTVKPPVPQIEVRRDDPSELAQFIERLHRPVLIVDERRRIVVSNRDARDLFRMPGAGFVALSSVIRRPEMLQLVDTCFATEQDGEVEIGLLGGDDAYRVSVSPMPVGGGRGVLMQFDDRSAIRRAERTRAEFLANASHELRTPLAALSGYIETMRGSAKDDVASWDRFLGIMYGQAERMRRLIDDLQSLSRIEHKEHSLPDSQVDLALIVREAVESLTPLAAGRGRTIQYSGPGEALIITGSRDEMMQVAQNLIDNAVKYSPEGGEVQVQLGTSPSAEEARLRSGRRWEDARRLTILKARGERDVPYAWLRVSDSGAGIPAEALPRLSERFYRVDSSRGDKVGGTGLGLAIVKHIMNRHRGGFIVESEIGRGAAFGVWLPTAMHRVD